MNNLRELRTAAKLTHEQLAEKIGVSYAAVVKWDLNYHDPNKTSVKKIREIFPNFEVKI